MSKNIVVLKQKGMKSFDTKNRFWRSMWPRTRKYARLDHKITPLFYEYDMAKRTWLLILPINDKKTMGTKEQS